MNKRNFLKTISGRKEQKTSSPVLTTSLSPYTGEWGRPEALHLLSRCTFGPTRENIKFSEQAGLNATLDKLFEPKGPYDPPISFLFDEIYAPLGESWVDKIPDPNLGTVFAKRRRSHRCWYMDVIKQDAISIIPTMLVMWHEHFAMGDITRANYSFHATRIFERNALGSFKTMTEEITINPAMLLYLNGNSNSKGSPNENFARELLELFTIGRGDDVGDGDYTNYTETDVFAMARALTGWRHITSDEGVAGSYFTESRHDINPKQLSHRFDNIIIENEGENEYKTVIDIIFQKQEVARFICRQLHIWFLNADIDENVENNIIEPMSQIMFDNDFEIGTALRTFLASEYFHDAAKRGCMVKSPIDFITTITDSLEIDYPESLVEQYKWYENLSNHSMNMGMFLTELPSVSGWKAFYQAPLFYDSWISAVTLNYREALVNVFCNGYNSGDFRIEIDFLKYLSGLENPEDPNLLIDEMSSFLFAMPISQNQKDNLKEALNPGLPDSAWTDSYNEYLSDPTNEDIKNALENKLKVFFKVFLTMPEFQLK